MKLLIPIEYYRHGGVERVIISLIREFANQIEQVIVILPPEKIDYFKNRLPPSEKIVYEPFQLPDQKSLETSLVGFWNKILSLTKQLKFNQCKDHIKQKIAQYRSQAIINYSLNKYQVTHCLYVLTNCLTPPKIKLPLGMISHDIYWHFAPLTYPEDYVKKYDQSLISWLKRVDLVIAVSEKTKQDILSLYPQFETKIKAICNSGYLSETKNLSNNNNNNTSIITFYFPSSFGIYKDQLVLLKAGLKLAQKGLKFKIIFTGKETDSLIEGKLDLSQQLQTQEYRDYVTECQKSYQENTDIFQQYFQGFGYVDEAFVESCYQDSACVIMPSQYEGFGLALSEAIVRGIPVICSDLAVFYEQVELYQCGDRVIFFPRGDADSLAECIENFINDPISKLTETQIKDRFSHWTWKEVAAEYIKLLRI
jgi:glycosyltransferase involved in cell wall biosynthesis